MLGATYNESAWVSHPVDTYMSWLQSRTIAGRPYAAKTIEQYSAMIGAFLRWQQSHCDRSLLTLTSDDLQAFTRNLTARASKSSTEASIRTRRVYLMEISRILDFMLAQGWRQDNPARVLVQQIKRQEPMKFRNTALAGLPVRTRYLHILNDLDAVNLTWSEVRAHAMSLLMIELGLTLKEVQKLTLQDIASLESGALHAPGHRSLRSRTLNTPILVQHWLRAWLAHRETFVIYISRVRRKKASNEVLQRTPDNMVCSPGLARVFVSLLSPRAQPDENGRRLAINRIDDRAIRQAANTALALAAPEWPSGIVHGPQMLRNLCFQRWVREHPDDEWLVAHMMGQSDTQQVRWMARLVGAPP